MSPNPTNPDQTFQIRSFAIPVSTSCARTRIVMDHKGLAYEELPPPDGYATQAYKSIIPAGTVPGLVLDGLPPELCEAESINLSDSGAQCLLLEALAPTPNMMPARLENERMEKGKSGQPTLILRSQLTALAAFHDTRLEPAVRALFPLVKPAAQRDDATNAKAFDLLQERINLLGTLCKPDPFLGGELFTNVDAAFPTTLYMGMDICARMDQEISVPPTISAWLASMNTIPAVTKTVALNRQAVADWIDTKLKG